MVSARFDWDDGGLEDLGSLRLRDSATDAAAEMAQRVGNRLRAFLKGSPLPSGQVPSQLERGRPTGPDRGHHSVPAAG
jgi:hypothetical protein